MKIDAKIDPNDSCTVHLYFNSEYSGTNHIASMHIDMFDDLMGFDAAVLIGTPGFKDSLSVMLVEYCDEVENKSNPKGD